MSVTVRPDPELPAVLDLRARAFPGEDLRPLVLALAARADEVVSLGAVLAGALVGHVMPTRCGTPGDPAGTLLGPLSVDAEVLGCGIGRLLVDTGLARLADAAVRQVCVLGDPRFYGRLGFAAESQVLPPCPPAGRMA